MQPYWWNERAGSLPAKAMEKAEQLYQIVLRGQQRQEASSQPIERDRNGRRVPPSAGAANGTVDAHSGDKPKVKAGTCILKDFGRTAKDPLLKDPAVSSAASDSKAAEWELQQQRLAGLQLGTGDLPKGDEAQVGGCRSDSSTVGTEEEIPQEQTLDGAKQENGNMSMEELNALFEIRKRSLQHASSAAASTADTDAGNEATATESTSPRTGLTVHQVGTAEGSDQRLGLRSVFEQETAITNWNGGFQG
jgi:hypothetical protein